MRILICLFSLLLLHYSMAIAAAAPSSRRYNAGECDALFHFSNSLSITGSASSGCHIYGTPSYAYPKTASWKNGTDCCSWDGVTCHATTNSVIGLDLSCSWLKGPLYSNSSLFLLPSLRWLNLAHNDFSGSLISYKFGIFRVIEHLNLSRSGFSGPIPQGVISHLSNLITLDLDGTDLSRVSPISLTNLSSTLTSLSLRYCSLRGAFPVDIFRLPNLRSLSLYHNSDLTGTLPYTNWTGPLISLDVSSTKFNGPIPASLGNLTSMKFLDLSANEFSGTLPQTLGNLVHLTELRLEHNNLSGSMDFEMFAGLKSLEHLVLPDSGLNVSLQSNGNCSFPRLRTLIMSDCRLAKFPYFLSSSTKLRSLFLSGNLIGGLIPEWLWRVGRDTLIYLDLSSNNFTGEIPSSICHGSSLGYLDLSNNRLNGTIPRCLGNLTSLDKLYLGDNLLHGPLPRSLANCTSLEVLNVSYNRIYDTFPRWLNASYFFGELYLQSNKFHGVIEVPLPLSVYSVDLSNNNFSGQLPTDFLPNSKAVFGFIGLANNDFDGSIPILPPFTEYCFMSNNKFSGDIADQICNARFLDIIDLSNNKLTGSIPDCLYQLRSLLVLDLQGNRFVGHIPDIFAPENNLRTIRLRQNQLGGTLPRSLEYCQSLEVLDLSENELEGSFPDWLGALQNLQVLVLRSNKFHGLVGSPNAARHPFPKLRILDLSNNTFYGPLPAKYITKLKAMKIEDKSGALYMGVRTADIGAVYQDSIVVEMKGVEMKLVKILTLLTTIDLSSNFFKGEIPEVIGDLKALKGLNFSLNNLSGSIPSSVGNLTNLEWLDLSSNNLGGRIPRGLADLAMLSWLNLSNNQLTGPIPQSTQFDTFNHSFDGNPALCGRPLPKACGSDSPSLPHEVEETESSSWFEWRAVPMGYGCGLAVGISTGYIMLATRRPRWLAKMVDRKLVKITSRTKKNAASRNRARRSIRG